MLDFKSASENPGVEVSSISVCFDLVYVYAQLILCHCIIHVQPRH